MRRAGPKRRSKLPVGAIGSHDCRRRLRLLSEQCGCDVTRLNCFEKDLWSCLPMIGPMLAVFPGGDAIVATRVEYQAVELIGRQVNLQAQGVDHVLDVGQMAHGFFVFEETQVGPRRSLQFFGRDGRVICKFFLVALSNEAACAKLVMRHSHRNQSRQVLWPPKTGASSAHRRRRLPIPEVARVVPGLQLAALLERVVETGLPLSIRTGRGAIVKARAGVPRRVGVKGPWIQILGSELDLHIRSDRVSMAWVAERPAAAARETSLEVFGSDGLGFLAIKSGHEAGFPEPDSWRDALLPAE